jgi:serine/threonine-protein kinase RsbW
MTAVEQRVFEARMVMLPETATFVESFCAFHGIGRADALRLTVIVEELFTNTVEHGYGGESDAPIRIVLSVAVDEVEVFYEDGAPRYDPLDRLSRTPLDLDATIDSRPVGGLGVQLVRQLTASARYVHADGFNRLWLRLRCARD